MDAFANAKPAAAASCESKCATAGLVGGVAVGVVGGGACYFLLKLGKPCAAGATWAGAMVNGWIAGSCQGLACS